MTTEEWRTKVDGRLGAIESRLSTVETQSAVDEVHRQNVERRLSGIEKNVTWLVRLIVGAILLAALAYALNGGLHIPRP